MLTSINNLGCLLLAKGDVEGAETLFLQALEGRRETLGDRHLSTLTSIYSLLRALSKQDLAARHRF